MDKSTSTGALLKLCCSLNGSSELGSAASEGAIYQVSSPHRSDPVAKALASLLLLLPYVLFSLSLYSNVPLLFHPHAFHGDSLFVLFLPYFILVLLENFVVCVPFSSSSMHDHKRTVQNTILFSQPLT